MNERELKLAACMMEQTGGAYGLSKLHLEKILDKGFRMCVEETYLKPCVRPHTQICPLLTTSAKIGGDAKSQQP